MTAAPHSPSTRRVVALVAGREITERLRSRSFWVLTGLLIVFILAFGIINRFTDDGPRQVDVAIEQGAPAELAGAIDQTAEPFGLEVDVREVDGAAVARRAVGDGDADVALLAGEGELVFADDIDEEVQAVLQQAWSAVQIETRLADAGLGPDAVAEALAPAPLTVSSIEGDGGRDGLAILVGTVSAVLLFISVQTFGGYVLVGVVEEKATAVIELLLVRARPDQLIAGKVIGIGTVALAQFALAVIAGFASLAISGASVPGEIWSSLPMALVWFLGGYALYSTLFALAGSLVSRQEDAQAAAAPITSVLLVAYLLVFVFGYVPESTASRIMSVLPPMAPLLMPMRMAAGAASVAEIALAVVLLALAIVAMWKLAGKIYEQVLLRRGSRISWREAFGLLRA